MSATLMARVLFVSKAVVPPWNDSSKNLAKALAERLQRHRPIVMTNGGREGLAPHVEVLDVYRDGSRFAPALRTQLRVLGALAADRRATLWHFFFAPNPRSSYAGRALRALRRRPTVQTLCSRPRELAKARQLLFADTNVVLSKATHQALLNAGVRAERLAHIPPTVPALAPLDAAARLSVRREMGLPVDAPLVVYPGDLEYSRGAERAIEAVIAGRVDVVLVMACRAKTPGARAAQERLQDLGRELGSRLIWVGETSRIHDLLGTADVVALPSTDLFAKMDMPLVLLEAMWLARAVLVVEDSPAAELAEGGGARVCPSREDAIAHALTELLDDDAGRASLGETARAVMLSRYSSAQMASRYEDVYEELVGR